MAVGLGYGDNFLAVLISNSAMEMARFLRESYPDQRETRASAYLGDLLVTCYSVYSRNRRLGTSDRPRMHGQKRLNEMTMGGGRLLRGRLHPLHHARHKVDMPIATWSTKSFTKAHRPASA